jgi:hypothetical protein
VAAVLVLNTPDDGRLRPNHVEWPCRNKTCTVLHQVGVSFDLPNSESAILHSIESSIEATEKSQTTEITSMNKIVIVSEINCNCIVRVVRIGRIKGKGIRIETGNTFFVVRSKASWRNLNSEMEGLGKDEVVAAARRCERRNSLSNAAISVQTSTNQSPQSVSL